MLHTEFYTNSTETTFLDKLKYSIDTCTSFHFSVSFIKKPGLKLLMPNIEAALSRGVKGKIITSTYQNFTDIESLYYFHDLMSRFPDQFECHLDNHCFYDNFGNEVGFHTKGYLFNYADHSEVLIGSSNITIYALLKNVEWDVLVSNTDSIEFYDEVKSEFDNLWKNTNLLNLDLIKDYRTRLYYSIERWDMDYSIANSEYKPNYMQRRALKELNRIRVTGAHRALVVASAGSGKTYLAAFDALNFNPRRLLYIAQEGSILAKAYESFQNVFGSDKSYGLFNGEFKELDADFVFSTNITMVNSLELFDKHEWDYIIVDECHHATASTYKRIIDYFEPQFLLGITATPERMDGSDVFELFDYNVPFELRLREAIINKLVVPFRYYGVRDELVEYSINESKKHVFVEMYSDEQHVDFISQMIEKYRTPGQKLKALAFCRDLSHAIRMKQAMETYYHTQFLSGKNSTGERVRAYEDLQDDNTDLEILFTVDILNEGVDIPGVNMVLFLRPTESQTIFIQQLGRGLRKAEGKQFVTVLDFIGNDYKRSVQIALALGSLSKNFVAEKHLISSMVKDDFKSLGLEKYGVSIHLDDLSKKEILNFIDNENFNNRSYLMQDYENFKKFIGVSDYPKHVDYLNNDFAPDLTRFMQSSINGEKNKSYYRFLKKIGETNLPSFDEKQEEFLYYLSDMLPIVREYEYLITKALIVSNGRKDLSSLKEYASQNISHYKDEQFNHALTYMLREKFYEQVENTIYIRNVKINDELIEYLLDLFEYGINRYQIEYEDSNTVFHLWKNYKKYQIRQLMCENPNDTMKGTKIYPDGEVQAYVTVIKGNTLSDTLKYADGYIDNKTFQWETVSNVSDKELNELKNSKQMHIFVRKVQSDGSITLPFIYIGTGKMEYIEGSKKTNGAHLFRVNMDNEAPEDIYFDFKLPS